jgi:hypothetical protein
VSFRMCVGTVGRGFGHGAHGGKGRLEDRAEVCTNFRALMCWLLHARGAR